MQRPDRLLLGACALSVGGVLGVLVRPMLGGLVYARDELGINTLVGRIFYRGALVRGDSFDWWPELDGGLFIHGLGYLGLYHPVNLVLYRLVPLPWSFDVEVLLGYPLLLGGTFWLLRRWDLSRPSALFGGTLMAFSGFPLLHHVHTNVVAVSAHIPWLLAMLDVFLRDESPRRRAAALAGVVLATGSQLLLHFPQVVVMSLLLEGAYCLAVVSSRRDLVRALPWLAAAKALGLAVGAIQLVPAWDYLQYLPVRADPSLELRFEYSLPPLNLLQLVSPYLPRGGHFRAPGEPGNAHEFGVYAGAASVALVVWVFMRLRSLGPRIPLALGLLALLLLSVDLSLGRWGLLYRFQVHVPVAGLFRAPCRYLLLVHLAMAGLGALAFEDLRSLLRRGEATDWRRLWPLALPPILGATIAAFALWPGLLDDAPLRWYSAQLATQRWILLGPALGVLAALLVVGAARGSWLALAALIVFAGADQGAYGLRYVFDVPPVSYEAFRTPPPLPPPDPLYRIHGGATNFDRKMPNIFSVWGYRLVNAYSGYHRRRELNYLAPKALRIAGVQWIYRSDLAEPEIQPLPDPMPRARLVTRAYASPHPQAVLPRIDIATSAIVSTPVVLDAGPPGDARIVEDRPGRITVSTEAETRQLLVLAEKHLDGWTVRVDGEPADLLRVYGDFMGSVVGPGRHEVTFDFDPPSLRLGRAVSLAGLAASCLLVAFFANVTARSEAS